MSKPYGRIKIQENEDGRKMLGGGCKTCPVIACATSTYRGSACASQRASYGLDDPMTNADHIRSMNDDGLAAIFCYFLTSTLRVSGINATLGDSFQESFAEWLAEPYKENADG